MTPPKIVVHTDILLDFLIHKDNDESVLRNAMWKFFCYTTVFNAIELFSFAKNEKERSAVERAMKSMKILGLNAKSAKKYGEILGQKINIPNMNMLIAGVCLESRLPLLTGQPKAFRGVSGLTIVSPSKVVSGKNGSDILREYNLQSRSN